MTQRISLQGLVILVVGIWLATFLVTYFSLPGWQERGQAGDLFGAANALFSGLAFAGLFYTIHLQRDQLKLQRDELALQRQELTLQREEMAGSRVELANQVRAQRAQFQAAVAQIRVASINARIEGIKLQAGQSPPHTHGPQVLEIMENATRLLELAEIVAKADTSA